MDQDSTCDIYIPEQDLTLKGLKQEIEDLKKEKKMLKEKYLLFAHNTFYPHGGWSDFQGKFDSVESAVQFLKDSDFEEAHLVSNGEIILELVKGSRLENCASSLWDRWYEEDERGDVKRVF